AGPVASVENGREFLVTRGEPRHRFLRADLADPDVAPPDLAAVRLELDRSRARQRLRPIPEVLHPGAVDGELVVQPHPGALADLDDADRVPLAERSVRLDERILAGRAGRVVPETAGALVGAEMPLAAFLRGVPDLHLR